MRDVFASACLALSLSLYMAVSLSVSILSLILSLSLPLLLALGVFVSLSVAAVALLTCSLWTFVSSERPHLALDLTSAAWQRQRGSSREAAEAAQAAEAATTTVIMLQSLSLPRPLATRAEHVNCIKPLASGARWAHPMTPPGGGNESKRDIHSCCREIKKVYSIEIFQLGQQLHEIHFPFERKYAMIQWKYEVDFHTFLTTLYAGWPAATFRYMALFCDLRCLFPILHSTKVLRPLKLVPSPRCTW